MSTPPCIFCEIVAERSPAEYVAQWRDAIAIVPLGPVVAGHTLVIPRVHVRDFAQEPLVTAVTMARASELVRGLGGTPANLITSAGREATQSVFHLHVHIVPRRENDGLALPWYSGRSKKAAPAVAAPDADSGETHRSCGCLTNSEGSHRGDCPEWETLEDRNGRYWLRRVAADGGMGS